MARKEKKELKKEKQTLKKKYKTLNMITGVLFGMFLTVSAYLIYNLIKLSGIETIIRYIVIFILGFIDLLLIFKYLKLRFKPLKRKYFIFMLIILLLGGIQFFIAYSINKGLDVVDNISVQKYKTYSTSLITLKSNNLTLEDINGNTKIGRVNDEDDIENYQLSKYLIEKDKISENQIENYDDPITMLYDLYENKVDAVFISGAYENIYYTMDKFQNIREEVIELDKYSKKMKVKEDEDTKASTKAITEPFTLLLMGVDSTEEDLTDSSGLGDSLVVITFNPETLNATILSIPRDTFVPITCYRNVKSKITHAASGGDSCMINTIENFLDVNIDYYAKINFRGLMKLVDALDGIDVEVPYSFCETTMWRSQEYMVYVEEGLQHLNGEQALALTRNRKTYSQCGSKWNQGVRNDFVRGQNQQIVINGMLNKAKNITSINQFYGLLDAVGSSMTTNMERKQILSFYNLFKNVLANSKDLTDLNNVISMQRMYLNGVGGLYEDGIMNMELYEYIPSNNSLNAIKTAMKVNLGLKDEEVVKTFSFSIDEEYEPKVIGKDQYGGVDVPAKSSSTSSNESINNTTVSCGTNEELGADGVTCLCSSGYTKTNGVCVKKENDTTKKTDCQEGYSLNSDNECVKDSKYKNQCVPENGNYYWYDSEGQKEDKIFVNSACSTTTCKSEGDYYLDDKGNKFSDASCLQVYEPTNNDPDPE